MVNVRDVMRRFGLGGDAVLLLLACTAWWLSPYWVFVMTSVVITALLCLSVGVTTERAGVISLCQVGMAGIGAWVATWVLLNAPSAGVFGAILAAGLAAAFAAVLIALPTLRVRGVHLAIVTLAFSLAINIFLTRVGFPGADEGSSYLREGWLESDQALFVFSAACVIACSRVLVWLEQRPFGSAWFGVKFSERAVAAFGVNVPWAKVSAFVVGAFVAGAAGALMVLQLGMLTSRNFEPMASMVIFALAVLSHSRFLSGALIAACLTWFVPEALTQVGLAEWKDMGDLLFALGALHALKGKASNPPAAALANTGREAVQHESAYSLPANQQHAGELQVQGLSVSYGSVKAVSDVSFSVKPGKVTGLVGPNGAGKSSLIDAISGFTPATGNVLLDGRSLAHLTAHERARLRLRRTFQVGRAIPELTVGQYLRLASRENPGDLEVSRLLEWLDCPPPEALIGRLDVGTRRLIEVAAALLSKPAVLLLDEPAAGMSAPESARLAKVIRHIPKIFGCGVLLIEHDLTLIREVCDELIVLEFGQVIAAGEVHETLSLPHVIEAYIGGEPA